MIFFGSAGFDGNAVDLKLSGSVGEIESEDSRELTASKWLPGLIHTVSRTPARRFR